MILDIELNIGTHILTKRILVYVLDGLFSDFRPGNYRRYYLRHSKARRAFTAYETLTPVCSIQ